MVEKIKTFLVANKITVILGISILLLVVGGIFLFKNFSTPKQLNLLPDIDLNFDAEGSYVVLSPRRDGNALNLSIKRVASFDAFSYQIAYSDETGIERGAGDLNTWIELKDKKGSFDQEILFGTCSKGATADPLHCVFDKGVENGTLILRIKKGDQPYKMLTQWHLQKPDIALGVLTSGDSHLTYKVDSVDSSIVGYTIINDLTGVPKLPTGKQVFGKVYSVNTPVTRELSTGKVSLELAEKPAADAKLYRYSDGHDWQELDSKITGSKLEASASGGGIFAVLVTQK